MKKLISFMIVCSMILILTCTNVFANSSIDSSEILKYEQEDFTKMSDAELNNYIDKIAGEINNNENGKNGSKIAMYNMPNAVQQAWLAAAQIARNHGYPCAASLVECSVNNVSYIEQPTYKGNRGQCYKKIIKTSAYKNYMKKINKKKKSSTGHLKFTKKMNADLFYALHNVDIATAGFNVGHLGETQRVTITDTFDFKRDNKYDDLFTSLVNNWAWLCQNASVLHKIKVKITFIERVS